MTETPLIEAAKAGDVATVRTRLGLGDDIEQKTGAGDNALAWAISNGHVPVVRLLLDEGSDPSLKIGGSSNMTLLQFAQQRGNAEIISLVSTAIAAGASPSEKWKPMGADSVAFVGNYPQLARKLTHIFNFESRERLIISENLRTNAETITQPTLFDDLAPGTVEKALEEFTRLGGKTDHDRALSGRTSLGKPLRKLPGPEVGHG